MPKDEKNGGEPLKEQKPATQLEEDDEFEDFPIEGTEILIAHIKETSTLTL